MQPINATPFRLVLAAGACLVIGAPSSFAQNAPDAKPAQPSKETGGAQPPELLPPPKTTVPQELEPYEGRPVRNIRLETPPPPPPKEVKPKDTKTPPKKDDAAKPEVAKPPAPPAEQVVLDADTEQLIRNQLRLKEGAPFDAKLVSEDMSRLNRLGRFASVESKVQLLADGSVDLIYVLNPQPIIRDVQTVGNKAFSDQDLGKFIDILVGTPVDPTRLDRACRRVEAAYREKGYFSCLVTIDEKELRENGNVYFKVREGEKVKVTEIRFEGNVSFTPRELGTVVKTQAAWLLDRGRLDNDILAEDVSSLISYYRDHGHIDARADRIVTPSPDGKEAVVTFVIDEGPVYTLKSVSVVYADADGQKVFSIEQLTGLMVIKPGDVFSDQKLRKSITAIREAYGKMGYVDTQVNRRERRSEIAPEVDIVLVVDEGRRFKTGEVLIKGNTLTRDDVLRRQVQVEPDRPLDSTAVEETKKRLERTNLFAPRSVKVTMQPERPEDPGFRDVLVEVEETNTGKFSIGGAVSSDAGLSASIAITQRNFDITDFPDTFGELFSSEAFRGGGQTFNITASPGTDRQYYTMGLSDPYLFDTDYSGFANIFYYTRYYTDYDENRIGTKFGVGRRFGSRWNFSLPVRIEQVKLPSIDDSAPAEYFKYEDPNLIIGAGISLSRSSIDDVINPSKGNKIEFAAEQVVGDYSYNILRAEYSVYTKLAEDVLGRKTTLQLTTRAGYIPQDTEEVPFYERFFMGGQGFRGFAFRGVSPVGPDRSGNPTDDPIGGNWMFFAGAEVKQPLYEEILSGVVFLDTGTVDTDVSFEHYRVSVGIGFRLYVQALSSVPLAFDFGFPIMKEKTDKDRLFTFSIDVPFN
ncbi:MAG: outer membrane protein assembly factor BamA [Planctomycetes bacterium]|nr:outer membrane protein assembly factor BamA [Planctomycetota bacterium]